METLSVNTKKEDSTPSLLLVALSRMTFRFSELNKTGPATMRTKTANQQQQQ